MLPHDPRKQTVQAAGHVSQRHDHDVSPALVGQRHGNANPPVAVESESRFLLLVLIVRAGTFLRGVGEGEGIRSGRRLRGWLGVGNVAQIAAIQLVARGVEKSQQNGRAFFPRREKRFEQGVNGTFDIHANILG